jgi:signal transduction histidine kinase
LIGWPWRPTAERSWRIGLLDEVAVQADRERLGLALAALLENAVRHTDSGDVIQLSVIRDYQGNAHGGDVTVRSTAAKGSEFEVTLPTPAHRRPAQAWPPPDRTVAPVAVDQGSARR